MILYKVHRIYNYHKDEMNHNKKLKNGKKKLMKPIVIYSTRNIDIENDNELKKLIESLPLNYFFYSSFSSFGVIMAPSIISVFWRVWHLIPLLINGDDNMINKKGEAFRYQHQLLNDPSFTLNQKALIVLIQFIHSMIVMYIVVKEYRLYILWKYYKIIDI